MNNLIAAVVLALSGTSVMAAEPVAAKTTPNAVVAPADKKEELNCVKKDKKGNCPPAPKSPKPTPKKKAEAK